MWEIFGYIESEVRRELFEEIYFTDTIKIIKCLYENNKNQHSA